MLLRSSVERFSIVQIPISGNKHNSSTGHRFWQTLTIAMVFESTYLCTATGACPLIHPNYFSVYLGLWMVRVRVRVRVRIRVRVRVNSVTETNMMTEK